MPAPESPIHAAAPYVLTCAPDGAVLAASDAARAWMDRHPGYLAPGLKAADFAELAGRARNAGHALPAGDAATLTPLHAGDRVAAFTLLADPPPPPEAALPPPDAAMAAALWEHFTGFANHTSDAFWVWQLNPERCVYMSPCYEALFGQPRALLEERPDAYLAVVHPEDLPRFKEARAAASDGYLEIEYRVMPPGQPMRWLSTRMRMQPKGPGPYYACGITTDISARKAMEEALRLGEERLRVALDGADVGIWDWRADTGATYYAPNLCAMLGIPHDEPRPPRQLMQALLSPDEFQRAYDAMRVPLRVGGVFQVEMRISIPGLGLRWFRVRGRSRLNPAGKPARASGSLLDITEDKRALRVLEQNERLYRQLFEQNPQCMWVYDQESLRIVAVNERAVRHYGYSRSEFLSMRLMDLHDPALHTRVEASARHPRDTVWRAGVWPQLTRDGRTIQVDVTTHETLFEGRPARMLLAEDITARLAAEQALKRSEERLEEAQRLARLGWWERDTKTGRIQWSRNLYSVLGVEPADFQGAMEDFLKLVHPEDRDQIRRNNDAALATGAPFENTFRIITGGRGRVIREHGRVERDEAGDIARIFGSAQDITPLWEAEHAARESEERLRRALMDAPIPAALLAEDGAFILVNQVWYARSGYTRDDFNSLGEWARLAYGPCAADAVTRALERFDGAADTHEGEFDVRARDGRDLVWDFNSSGVGRLPDGRRVMVVMAMDVTERHLALARVLASEERFRVVAQSTNDAVWELDLRTDAIWWNDRFYDAFAFSRDEDAGSVDFWSRHVHPEDRDRVVASLRRAMDEGAPAWREEYRFIKGNGDVAIIVDQGFMLHDEAGRPARLLGGMADVTATRQAEAQIRALNAELEERVRARTRQLEEANQELEAFSYSISHDLRAPLRAIDGFSRILLEEADDNDLNPDMRRHLGVIRASTQHMGQLIDDLLAFSRLSRQALTREPVDMERLVGACVRQIIDDTGDRPVEVVLDPLPPCLGDARLLRQVWTNLLSNAFKYTRKRPDARVCIGAAADCAEPGLVAYYVRDNGVGFDMAYANKLFGVFQRLHRAEDYEGTGVGLAIVQRIVHRHGGRVWADAAPGEGATFHFSLPAATTDEEYSP
jgi:PAS domain S-box-containing protein